MSRRSTKWNDASPAFDSDDKYDKAKSEQQGMRRALLLATVLLLMLGGATYMLVVKDENEDTKTVTSIGESSTLRTPPQQQQQQQQRQQQAVESAPALEQLEAEVAQLDAQVRKIKQTGVIMETDETSKQMTGKLQAATRALIKAKYGDYPHYRVQVELEFQPTMPDFATLGKHGQLTIEMAPIDLIPVSVYTFLEVARTYKGGAFHRNAGHVLQATANSAVTEHLPFQEYSPEFPHVRGTTGYCGRPSGPCWYISIQDNTINHGPGSQQKKNPYEADANFGKIVQGMDDVVPRIHSTPGRGWLDKDKQILIRRMTILVPKGPNGEFVEWKEHAFEKY